MSQIRLAVLSAALVAASFAAMPQTASARALGGFSLNATTPPIRSPNGVYLCTVNLRLKIGPNSWTYHMASGYDFNSCNAEAQKYISWGYETNPNPGTGYCTCYPDFNGMQIATPVGNGPLGGHDLSPAAVQAYSEGLQELRQRYHFDEMAKEQEELLDAVMAADGQKGD